MPARSVLLALLMTAALHAQPPVFEVATVKRAPPPEGDTYGINLGTTSHGMVTLTNTTLADSMRFAYQIPSDAQIAGPEWIKDKTFHYVIVGKAAPDTPREQLLQMLQTLLLERFRMAVHREPRELTHYELTIAKNGPKLQPSKLAASGQQSLGIDHIDSPAMTMYTLCVLLARFELPGAIIVDRTGLKGLQEIKLVWTPAGMSAGRGADPGLPAGAGPSIFSAVKEQLGLTLESKKGPVEVLVVDRAEKEPVEN
jgi:uncharacterized protein (TIGR03435 family)